MATVETVTYTVESPSGETDEVTLPAGLLERFAEEGEGPMDVFGDIAVLAFAQQIHGAVHHGHGEVDDELEAIEERMLELFEERFGRSFGEMTGHSH